MSVVYHHLRAPSTAFREVERVLRVGGYLCMRSPTLELLHKVPYFEFFPSALSYSRASMPSQQTVLDIAAHAGFSLVAHDILEQEVAASPNEYYDRISQRALSDLVALTDPEFDAGLERMRLAVEREAEPTAILEPINLFVWKRPDM